MINDADDTSLDKVWNIEVHHLIFESEYQIQNKILLIVLSLNRSDDSDTFTKKLYFKTSH